MTTILQFTKKCAMLTPLYCQHTFKINLSTGNRRMNSFRNWYRNQWIAKNPEPPFEHVTQIGDPVLRRLADAVPPESITSKEIEFLVNQMTKVMRLYNCVGLSAPQIGIPLRVIVMEFSDNAMEKFSKEIRQVRQMERLPLTVFFH